MRIGGIQKNSFVDYPGHIAAVVFTVGCNMNCFYCHNKHLLKVYAPEDLMPEEEVLSFLRKRKDLLDGVVISGGEPTLQKDLPDFIQKVKRLGFRVKLDTNGSNPDILRKLIKSVDFVAMDIKAPFGRYEEFSGVPDMAARAQECIDLILESGIAYQFRTTMAPGLTEADVQLIRACLPEGANHITQECVIRD